MSRDTYTLPSGLAALEDAQNIGSANFGCTYIMPISPKNVEKALQEALRELHRLTNLKGNPNAL